MPWSGYSQRGTALAQSLAVDLRLSRQGQVRARKIEAPVRQGSIDVAANMDLTAASLTRLRVFVGACVLLGVLATVVSVLLLRRRRAG